MVKYFSMQNLIKIYHVVQRVMSIFTKKRPPQAKMMLGKPSLPFCKRLMNNIKINYPIRFKSYEFHQHSHVKEYHLIKIVKRHLYGSSYQWLGNVDMHMYANFDQNNNNVRFRSYEHYH